MAGSVTTGQITSYRGYWCVFAVTPFGAPVPTKQKTYRAMGVTEALRWVRTDVRTISPALPPAEAERAFNWIECDQWAALHQLAHEQPCSLTLDHQGAALLWSVRPVRFLPLVGACLVFGGGE
ncbi:hypothetical protein [Streptomyces sp. NPDC050507]|uniref:hypothetical protein n=1 Tax=Streptomyces sp. NPDC050507 TaxID=3365619 RepID=UPI0037B34F60